MRSGKRRVADDSDDDDDDIAYTKKKQEYSGDDDDLPSFAAVASTSSKKAGTRTSLRKVSAAASSSSTSSAPAPAPKSAPAPGPAPARRARPKSTAASKAAATASQTAPKKVLTAAEQEELRKIREKEREEDDFFTSKREFTFKTGGKRTALALPKSRVAPSSSSQQPAKAKPTQKIVINLDQEEYSSSADSHSDSGSDSSETLAKRKRRKKSKTPVKLASPTKRAASSSSSSSSDSDSDSSAQRRKKRVKAEKKESFKSNGANGAHDRKGKGRASDGVKDEPRNRERSLSPLAQADTFEVAHALQDIRRHRPSMGRRYNVSSEGEDLGQEANDELGDLVGIDGPAGPHASRSRSASHARGDSTDPPGHNTHTRTSMTPFADEHEMTEEEKEAKYGPVTSISVKMVHDPRIVVTDQNKNGVKRYTAAMDIKVRSRENFEHVFGRVSTEKGIARSDIVITYNGQRLYSVGTPHSLSILSSANFEAYPREVFEYVQQQRRERKARELAQAREHQLESLARVNMPGAQRNRAIDLDEADEGRLAAIAEDGNDSDIEMVMPGGGRLASLQPAGVANRRDERSVSLAAADTANAGASAAPKEPALKVTIRGGPQQQLNLRVPLTKTISTLIKAYLKKFNHDMALSSKCKVFFDGEALSHECKLEDADIEDEDTLDIRVPSS